MKTLVVKPLIFVAAFLFGLISLSAQEHTREELQQVYIKYLESEGYPGAFVDSDGDVQFKFEGKTYYFDVEEDDPTYFRVVLPNIWELETEAETIAALIACNDATNRTKVAKATVGSNNNVSISMETLIAEHEDFRAVFKRSLSVINTCKGHFVSKMREFLSED